MSEEGFAINKNILIAVFLGLVLIVSIVFSIQLSFLNNSLAEQQVKINQLKSSATGLVGGAAVALPGVQASSDPMAGHHSESSAATQVGGC